MTTTWNQNLSILNQLVLSFPTIPMQLFFGVVCKQGQLGENLQFYEMFSWTMDVYDKDGKQKQCSVHRVILPYREGE